MDTLLYEKLASNLIDHIQEGVYRVDEKLPSVRRLAEKEQVSIATVNSAYALLEERGWISAKPKSGYFVRRTGNDDIARPKLKKLRSRPRAVSSGELVLQVQRDALVKTGTNFGSAVPDLEFDISRVVQKTFSQLARSGAHLGEGYDATEGMLELRGQIARRAVDAGIHIGPDEVITTLGAQNAMALALRSVTQPGDIVAVESPCYFGLLQLIESLGLKAIEIPIDSDTGLSVDALKLALQNWPIKTILTVSTFANPMGCLIPDSNKKAILSLIAQYDISLIEDDIYGELFFGQSRPKTFKAFDDEGRVLWCSSVSKTMDPQVRVGWISPGRYADAVLLHKFSDYLATPSLTQAVVYDVMRRGLYDRHLRQARMAYKQRAEHARFLALQYFPEETLVSKPRGGLVAWYEMPKQVNATELYYQLLEDDIRIAPGELFSTSGHYRHCLRLNYAFEWTGKREKAFLRIGELLKQSIMNKG